MNASRYCIAFLPITLLYCLSACKSEQSANNSGFDTYYSKINYERIPQLRLIFHSQWEYMPGKGDAENLWTTDTSAANGWIKVNTDSTLEDQKQFFADGGFGCYRKIFTLSEKQCRQMQTEPSVMLSLGTVIAADEVYINGRLAGKTGDFPPDYKGYFDHERKYLFSSQYLQPGKNSIAVKFFNGWSSAGGFVPGARLVMRPASRYERMQMRVTVPDSDYIFTDAGVLPQVDVLLSEVVQHYTRPLWLKATITTDDFQPLQCDSLDLSDASTQQYSFRLNQPCQPGFYRFTIELKDREQTHSEKKLNLGYMPENMDNNTDAAADLDSFWEETLSQLAAVDPQYQLTEQPQFSNEQYTVYRVDMRSWGNEPVSGYYAKPNFEGKFPVIVEYMGYNSSPYPPNTNWDGFAYFVLSVRGQGLNAGSNRFGTWITYGIDSKDDYYYRGAFMDVVRAVDFVCSRPEIDCRKIGVRGGSQGGAFSFAAAALDKRVAAAAPNVPFLSDWQNYFRIVAWPRSDFERYKHEHPDVSWKEIYDVLSYFDIKNLAHRITCPILMGVGVQDEVCPNRINFAAYNQVPSQKQWIAYPDFGHSVGTDFYNRQQQFFGKYLGKDSK